MNAVLGDPRVRSAAEVFGPGLVIVVGTILIFGVNPIADPGVYVIGLVFGMLGALTALGMALIYRSNRILNFAQGELGLAPSVGALGLITFSAMPYVFALLFGLGAAVLLGVVVEFVIIRRFAKAPRLILTVATIGLSQLLTVASLAIPRIWDKDPMSQKIVAPFDIKFEVAPITFTGNHVIALVVAPLVILGVAIFLKSTNIGIAVRASAERSDRANMLGVPVKRIQTLVWGLAALLSFTGVFLKAGVVGLPFASNEGFGTTSFGALLAALAALTLGRFTNLPSVAVSAMALGILEQSVVWRFGNKPELIYPVLAVVILVGLAIRKTGQSRTAHDTADSWQGSDEVRPIPLELRRIPEVAVVKWGALALLAIVAFRLPAFGFMDSGNLIKASAVVLFGIIGVSIIMLTGWAGQVTLGQMAVVGVGAVTGALATSEWGLDLSLAVLIGGLAGSVVAVIIGLPALRVRGMFLAVTTLAFAITASNFLLNPTYFAWIPKGRIERPPLFGKLDLEPHANMYYLCLVVLVITLLGVRGLRRSRTGRVMLALRENERAAQSFGISLTRAKLTAFALSGFFAAVAGAMLVHVTQRFTAAEFGAGTSFAVFTSTVVGGLGSMTGGLIGALFSRGGTWFLQGNWQLLPSAIGVLAVLLALPSGLGGAFFQVRDAWLRSVARRNGIVVPSLLADVAQPEDVVEQAELSVEHHEIDPADGHISLTDDAIAEAAAEVVSDASEGTPDPDERSQRARSKADQATAEAAARLASAEEALAGSPMSRGEGS
jgi:branched-chain amino acid transport system permease protein